MSGYARERVMKRRRRLVRLALSEPQRANGIPRVRAALACVEMAARLERQFTLERLERLILVPAREAHQTAEPVKRDAAEARRPGLLARLSHGSRVELALRLVQCVARDVDGGRQPVRERKSRQQRQRAPRFAEPLLTP